MKTQTLLQAVVNQFDKWPSDDIAYFNCDPDGEVRERGPEVVGRRGTEYDFYPKIKVVDSERKLYCGYGGEFVVTKEDFINAKVL